MTDQVTRKLNISKEHCINEMQIQQNVCAYFKALSWDLQPSNITWNAVKHTRSYQLIPPLRLKTFNHAQSSLTYWILFTAGLYFGICEKFLKVYTLYTRFIIHTSYNVQIWTDGEGFLYLTCNLLHIKLLHRIKYKLEHEFQMHTIY